SPVDHLIGRGLDWRDLAQDHRQEDDNVNRNQRGGDRKTADKLAVGSRQSLLVLDFGLALGTIFLRIASRIVKEWCSTLFAIRQQIPPFNQRQLLLYRC